MNFTLRLCLTLAVCATSFAVSVHAQEDDPTVTAWKINTDGATGVSPDEDINAIVSQYLADVLAVYYNEVNVYVKTNSLPSHPIGPFNDGNPAIPIGEEVNYRFPRITPEPAFDLTPVGIGEIGIFINGVAMYNYSDTESYEDKGIWLNNAIHVRASGFDSSHGHPSPNREDMGGGQGGGDNGGGTPPDQGGGDNGGGTPPDQGGGGSGGGIPPDNGGGGTPPNGGPGGGGPGGGSGPAPNSIFPLTKDTSVRYVAAKIAQEGQSVDAAMPAAHRMMHEYEILHNHVSPSQQQGPGGEGQQGGGGETVTGFYHYHQQPPLLREQIGDDGSKHSPIIGYMFDGFPVYGPYGYDNVDGTGDIVIIQSSYRLRDMTDRSTLSGGTVLDAVEHGPAIDAEYPLGYFVQDYEYIEGHGHLDEFNGRFAVTPEYPNGVYAYYATIDDDGNSAFPYLIGPNYYGDPDVENIRSELTIPENTTQYMPESLIQYWTQY